MASGAQRGRDAPPKSGSSGTESPDGARSHLHAATGARSDTTTVSAHVLARSARREPGTGRRHGLADGHERRSRWTLQHRWHRAGRPARRVAWRVTGHGRSRCGRCSSNRAPGTPTTAPSEQVAGSFASLDVDARFTGMGLAARYDRDGGRWGIALRAGGSAAQVHGNQLDGAGRTMGFARRARSIRPWTWRGLTVAPLLHAEAAQGGTGGDSWTRTLDHGGRIDRRRTSLAARRSDRGAHDDGGPGEFGRAYEQFTVGGG